MVGVMSVKSISPALVVSSATAKVAGVLPSLLMTTLVVMVSPMERLTVWLGGEREALTFSPTRTGTTKLVMYTPVPTSNTSTPMFPTLLAGALGSVVTTIGNFTMCSVELFSWLATSAGTFRTVVDGMMLLVENDTSQPSGT